MNDVKVEVIKAPTMQDWTVAKTCTLATVGKDPIKPVDDSFKRMLITTEHSPLRTLWFCIKITNIPYYVSTHFVRHKIGVEHFVRSQRNDRQELYDRETAPQNAPVTHILYINAQELLFVSRRRICTKADKTTRAIWLMILKAIKPYEPILYQACVPECIYRGGICPEKEPCKIKDNKEVLKKYKELFDGH